MKITLSKKEKEDLYRILNYFIRTYTENNDDKIMYKDATKLAKRIIKKL